MFNQRIGSDILSDVMSYKQCFWPDIDLKFPRYCQLLFDGDMYKVGEGALQIKEAGSTSLKSVATPFKKYYSTEDYVYCTSYDKCKIFIGGQEMLDLYCKYYYFTIGVSTLIQQKIVKIELIKEWSLVRLKDMILNLMGWHLKIVMALYWNKKNRSYMKLWLTHRVS